MDHCRISDSRGAPMIPGARFRAGETRTVDVFLFSDAPTPRPWTITAREAPMIATNPQALTLALDRTSGTNGEKVHLTIKANMPVSNGVTIVVLISRIGTRTSLWF